MAHTADTPCGASDADPLGVESPVVVPPLDPNMSRGTSPRRSLWSRRVDISLVLSPRTRSKQGERYGDHRAPDENIRSPRFHSPPKRSESVPFSKRSRLEDGRKGSSSGGWYQCFNVYCVSRDKHCCNDEEGNGSRGRYDGSRHTQELGYPTSCDHMHHHFGSSKRNSSPHRPHKRSSVQRYSSSPTYFCEDEHYTQRKSSPNDHGKRSSSVQQHPSPRGKSPSPMPMEISPWDDGYKIPSSPSYSCEDAQYTQSGSHDDDQDATSGTVGRSGVVGRESILTKKEDSAYDVLVDDFMDAVPESCYNHVSYKTVDGEAYQKQTNRFAELALKRYNKNRNNKVKYALVEATVSNAIFEDSVIYAHVNFYAKAKNGPKKNSGKVLVFAELHQIGRRLNAMVLTCFRFLDESNQFCGRYYQVRSPIVAEDIKHCYACTDKIKHPHGSCYKAGHIVDMLYYD